MDMAVKQIEAQFDSKLLQAELSDRMAAVGHQNTLQFILTHIPDYELPLGKNKWTHGAGSLFDDAKQKWWARTADFSKLDESFDGTYTASVIEQVRAIALTHGKKIGRVRVLTLAPKTCYSLHTDKEEFRFHIPLMTSGSSFFICNDLIDRMPVAGQLYKFQTNEPHTAVNAHKFEQRSHLVFDTYE